MMWTINPIWSIYRVSDISPMPEEYLLISSWLLYLISEIIAISGLVGITGPFGNHNKLT